MAHSTVKKLFSLLGNSGKPDSAPLRCGQTQSHPRFIAFDASKICIFNAILAAKQAARKKFFTRGKNCFVAQAACSKVAQPDFALNRQDTLLQSPVQLQDGTGPARAARRERRLDGGDACNCDAGKSGSAPGWPAQGHDRRAAKYPAPTEQGPDKPDNKGRRPEKALTQRRDRW